MSAWAEQEFPISGIITPFQVTTALRGAALEREKIGAVWQDGIPDIPKKLDSIGVIYHTGDALSTFGGINWVNPDTLSYDLSDDRWGSAYTWETILDNETLIRGNPYEKLSPKFYTALAKQQYKILNRMYLKAPVFLSYLNYYKSREAFSYDSFADCVEQLSDAEWNYYHYIDVNYVPIGQMTTLSRFDSSGNSWRIIQTVENNIKIQVRNCGIVSSLKHWRQIGLGWQFYSDSDVTINNDGTIVRYIFDACGSGFRLGQEIQGSFDVGINDNTIFELGDLEQYTPPDPINPGTVASGTTATISGFTLGNGHYLRDFSPGLQYLDLPQF